MITIGKTATAPLQFGQLSPVLSAFDQFGADTSQTTSGWAKPSVPAEIPRRRLGYFRLQIGPKNVQPPLDGRFGGGWGEGS
jgi:hypothetical protein